MYETASGRRPVRDFLRLLSDEDAAAVAAAMADVRDRGLEEARHLRDDIYEVRADGERAAYRILFAPEGRQHQVLLALEAFSKKSQTTPPRAIALAQRRLADWRRRGRS